MPATPPAPPPPPLSPLALAGIITGSVVVAGGIFAAGVAALMLSSGRPRSRPEEPSPPADPAVAVVEPRPDQAEPPAPPRVEPGPTPVALPADAGEPGVATLPGREVERAPGVELTGGLPEVGPPDVHQEGAADAAAVEPPPADPAAAATTLVAGLPAAIDAVPIASLLGGGLEGLASQGLDLGPCTIAELEQLEVAVAQPNDKDLAGDAVRLRVSALPGDSAGWQIGWTERGLLEGDVARSVASLTVEDQRLQLKISPTIQPAAARSLASSVLLVRAKAAGGRADADWKPVRLLRPGQMLPLELPILKGGRASLPLPTPGPFAAGLPPGCRLELESERGDLTLEPKAGKADGSFEGELPWVTLDDGTKLVVRVRVEPGRGGEERSTLLAEVGISGMEKKGEQEREKIRQLASLGQRHDLFVRETLDHWDKHVGSLVSGGMAPIMVRQVPEFLGAPLPPHPKKPIPLRLETLGNSLDAFFVAQAEGNRFRGADDLPVSVRDWQEDWAGVISNAGSNYAAYNQQRWNEIYAKPLRSWWDDYRPKAEQQLKAAAEAVAELSEDIVVLRVKQAAIDAVGPGGTRYAVPLLEAAAPVARDDNAQPKVIELD